MAEDDLDLSEFEEFSRTARRKGGGGGGGGAAGGGDGGGSRKRRRWPWFLAGLVLGAVGAVFGPELAAPYLPDALRPSREEIRGPVLGKRSEGDRLLLTVDSDRGAVLATFRQRVPEIDLLVEEGDTVTLGLDAYAPLVEDPVLEGVRKGRPRPGAGPAAGSDPGTGREGGGAAADTLPADSAGAASGDDTPGG